ncbi:3'-5' exonuclease [Microbacterium sp. LMI1x-1-1.1]|uniref:3'-5' exonuclease n=1 Tax=Microbacterium sp. LMI1x-1-1.1 TaxID=3135246 RepID=UPI003446F969
MPLPPLTGQQHHVAYLDAAGHQVIQGTAGSGKTVMAVLRAGYLVRAATPNHGPALLLTHDNSLVNYLRHLAGGQADAVTVETYARFARGYLASLGRMGHNAISGDAAPGYLKEAIAEVRTQFRPNVFFDRPLEFFMDELEWIGGMGIPSLDDYLNVERAGRKEPLQPGQRRALWRVVEAYERIRTAGGHTYDWWTLATAVRSGLATDGRERVYRHIVVDEAQDFPPEVLRSLAEAIQPGGSLTVFMDQSQQIYGQRTSWKAAGLTIAKVHEFSENYRNTPEIAAVAVAMAEMPHFQDTPDLVLPKTPRRAAGAKPTLYMASTAANELRQVRAQVEQFGRTARVAVLGRRREAARRAVGGIVGARLLSKDMPPWDDSPGVYYGTFYAAKGLEFEMIAVPFADASLMPESAAVAAYGVDEALARESRLLYVAVTRARTELLISCSTGTLTSLLPAQTDPMWAVVTD